MNIKPCENNEIEMTEIKGQPALGNCCPTGNKSLDNPSWFI
jgi:hypothetical protein